MKLSYSAAAVLAVLLTAHSTQAQVLKAQILGTVTDASGAFVPTPLSR